MAVKITADDVVTRITNMASYVAAQDYLLTLPITLLREVADLTYACDWREARGRAFLIRSILSALS
jgi:hypothetical protein